MAPKPTLSAYRGGAASSQPDPQTRSQSPEYAHGECWTVAPSDLVLYGNGKGYGVFAARKIEAGETIIEDEALIVSERMPGLASYTEYIIDGFRNLSPEEQKEYLSKFTHSKSEADLLRLAREYGQDIGNVPESREEALEIGQVVAIFRNNAFTIAQGATAFCKDAARLNHSCVPNAMHVDDQVNDCYVVRATREINEGEELLLSYVPEMQPKADRQSQLEKYGFTCTCVACEDPVYGAETEPRRRELKDLAGQVASAECVEQYPNTAEYGCANLLKPEGIPAALVRMLEILEQEPAMLVDKAETARNLAQR
ncbi:uncharacterized protein LTR77_004114 [Saxophila tyrrhenica]|uniref:SET domain-containing protein n=1 Tax=Saxophila tyrrhenica TaxID=1690608 RepID=A0AAV9PCJ7_9PEZI|nr:hypothetical protein LTR77_004114 [Saxophila tyrrhenica]